MRPNCADLGNSPPTGDQIGETGVMTPPVQTSCPLDCPDTCSLAVTVTDGRITKIDAAPGNPLTAGFICQKVKHHAQRIYSPIRIQTPLVRNGPKGSGEFRVASWDEALDLVVDRMRDAIATHGAESIVPYLYNSSAGALQSVLTERLFRRLGATEVDHTICALTHGIAYESTYDGMASADSGDVVHSKLIVLWGANPTASNTHLLPLLNVAQREHGARLIVVDPRRTGVAKRADHWVAVRPGTDVVLAYAIARELEAHDWIDRAFVDQYVDGVEPFLDAARVWTLERAAEICGVDPHEIASIAHDLASIRPAMVRPGWGLERTRNGGSACAAVMALPALVGQFGVLGSGILVSQSEAAPLDSGRRSADERHTPRPRHLNMNELGAKLTDEHYRPRIAVLFVQGANPVVMNPNQHAVVEGLAREDLFTVVHEQVLTDTARWADVVLPAASHFEYDDIAASYGSYVLQPIVKVVENIGESVSNHELAVMLGARFGFSGDRFPQLSHDLAAAMMTDGGDPLATRVLREPGSVIQFATCAPRRGKANLAGLPNFGVPRYEELHDRHPLTLITPASPRLINSMFGEFNNPDVTIRIHPDDAAPRGLTDGCEVRVFNDAGSVLTFATFDDDVRPGVVSMTKGVWLTAMPGGVGVNALVPDTLSDVGDGACFNDARVEVTAQ